MSNKHAQCTPTRLRRPTRRLSITRYGVTWLASDSPWVASVTHFLSSLEACDALALASSLLTSIVVFVEVGGSELTLFSSSCTLLVQRLLSAANTGEANIAAEINRPASAVRFMDISFT
ncbi:hypothetical protein EMIT0P294_90191 [Pseudomonas sp. IT-P294]